MLIPRPLLYLAQAAASQPAHAGITAKITEWAEQFIHSAGYPSAAILMALESMIAPIPSEAVMPFVGFAVHNGEMNVYLALLATTAGSLIGSLISYYLGYFGGKPLVMKVGRFLLLNEHHLDWTISFFHKRSGKMDRLCLPFRPPSSATFISIPPPESAKCRWANSASSPSPGATMWNGLLLAFGYYWHSHLEELKKYYKMLDVAVIILGIVGLALWFYLHLKKPAKPAVPTDAK